MVRVRVECLSKNATIPVKATDGSVGFDLYAANDRVVPSCASELISTDLSMMIPVGTYGRIAPRSGLAIMYQIDVLGGVIGK